MQFPWLRLKYLFLKHPRAHDDCPQQLLIKFLVQTYLLTWSIYISINILDEQTENSCGEGSPSTSLPHSLVCSPPRRLPVWWTSLGHVPALTTRSIIETCARWDNRDKETDDDVEEKSCRVKKPIKCVYITFRTIMGCVLNTITMRLICIIKVGWRRSVIYHYYILFSSAAPTTKLPTIKFKVNCPCRKPFCEYFYCFSLSTVNPMIYFCL